MRPAEEGLKQFRATLTGENGRGILQDLTYRVEAGDARSAEFTVKVLQPPSARVNEVRYEYPPYMQLEPKSQQFGHIDAWEGTKVSITATANMPVTSAVILFSDSEDTTQKAEEIKLEIVEGTKLRAEWNLAFRSPEFLKGRSISQYPRFYRIQCTNENGETDPQPALHNITIRPDQAPVVELLEPREDSQQAANAIVPLTIRARDPDFLLRYVNLRIAKEGEQLNAAPQIFDGHRQSFSTIYEWHLHELNLKRGDVITYWIEARDNKQPFGNRTFTSPKLKIEIGEEIPEQQVKEQLKQEKQRQQDLLEQARQDAGDNDPQQSQPENQPEQKEPGQQPDQQQKSKSAGQKSDKPNDRQKTAKKDSDQGPSEQPKSGEGSESQKLRKDGSDDQEVLQKLLDQERKRQQEQKKSGTEDSQPDKNPNDGKNKPQGDKNDGSQKKPDQNKSDQQKKDGSKNGGESKQGEDNQGGNSKPGNKPDDNKSAKSGTSKRPGDKSGSKDAGDKKGNGGSGKSKSKGKPSDDQSPTKNSQPGKGGDKKKSDSSSKKGRNSDQPLNGKKETADSSKDAKSKKATGDEKGPATSGDPNSDPHTSQEQTPT